MKMFTLVSIIGQSLWVFYQNNLVGELPSLPQATLPPFRASTGVHGFSFALPVEQTIFVQIHSMLVLPVDLLH